MVKPNFGGNWTEEKLDRVQKYLQAYTTIMNNQKSESGKHIFDYAYIDAFAGTGFRVQKGKPTDENQLILPELGDGNSIENINRSEEKLATQDMFEFRAGSAKRALQVDPPFKKYIFIEKNTKKAQELQKLKEEFPNKTIQVVQEDANTYIQGICRKNWNKHRAVMFLDPYGMQVYWDTIKAIANTKSIDLWYLFPLMAVNRLLKKDGGIQDSHKDLLDRIFGTESWYDTFYETRGEATLFGDYSFTRKTADGKTIGQYFVERLRSVFSEVSEKPLILYNSCQSPLFLLCFASGNPKGSKTAIKIAKHILKK